MALRLQRWTADRLPVLPFQQLEQTTIGAVAAADRPLGVLGHGAVWASLGSGLYLIVVGAWLVPALSISQAIIATAVGAALGSALVALAVHIGATENRPAVVLHRGTLGDTGASLYGGLAMFRHVAWGAIQIAIAAELMAAVAERNGFDVGRGFWAAVIGGLVLLMLIGGPATVLKRWVVPSAGLVVLVAVVMTYSAWSDFGVPSMLFREPSGGWPGMTGAIDLVAALAILWLPVAADVGRLGRPRRAWPAAFAGLAAMTAWFVLIGILFVPAVDGEDVAGFLLSTPLGLMAILLVILLELDGAFVSLYALVSTTRGWFPKADAAGHLAVAGAAAFIVGGTLLDPFEHADAMLLLGAAFIPLLGVLLGTRVARRAGSTRPAPAGGALAWGLGFLLYNWASPLHVPGWSDAWSAFLHGWLGLPFPAGVPGLSATALGFVASFVASAGTDAWRVWPLHSKEQPCA
jgi:purine-cytosine permease-like protein